MTHRNRKAPKIKWSLFASFTAVTALILMMVTLLQLLLIDMVYGWTMRNHMKSLVYEIGYLAEDENFEEMSLSLAQEASTAMTVYLFSGESQSILAENYDPLGVLQDLDSAEITTLYRKTEEHGGFFQETLADAIEGERFSSAQKKGRLLTAFITLEADGDTVFILLDTALKPLISVILFMQNRFTLVFVIMLCLSAGIAFLLAKHISAPIERISKKAKKMSKGEYNLDFSERSYQEIEELSEILNQTSDELSKVDRLQKELIANISHDLRTPLTMIVGYAEVMRDIEGENTPANMQVIIDEATRLSSLVNDLLEISHFQSGSTECHKEHFCLSEVTKTILARYRHLKENSGFVFLFEERGKSKVLANEARITQVLCNLLNNAINYSQDDKTITVRVLEEGTLVRVEVEDHGMGISAEDLPNVWNRYYRVDKNHRRSVVGSGLGLSIVREILDMHGARYGVFSEFSVGTTFWFELPLCGEDLCAEEV